MLTERELIYFSGLYQKENIISDQLRDRYLFLQKWK